MALQRVGVEIRWEMREQEEAQGLLFKEISLYCNFPEYEVVSTENGASDGEKEKSIITTNQTHSTVENLKPDTR